MLVTAPKDPLFLVKTESTEKLRRIRQIRVLVFSDKDVVKVTLDGSEKGRQTSLHNTVETAYKVTRYKVDNFKSEYAFPEYL